MIVYYAFAESPSRGFLRCTMKLDAFSDRPETPAHGRQFYSSRSYNPMNTAIIGADSYTLLQYLPDPPYLFIDDGALIDQLELPTHRKITHLDLNIHHLNPVQNANWLKAWAFIENLNATFPASDATITRQDSDFYILQAILKKPGKLEHLIKRSKETEYAWKRIQTLLLSDELAKFITKPTNFSLKATVIARLDRSVLGDKLAFFIGNLLMSHYQGSIVVPDYGFYHCGWHTTLIRQNRLTVGIRSFRQVEALEDHLLQFERKIASQATPDDAKMLAQYAGKNPVRQEYGWFVEAAIKGTPTDGG